MGKQGRLSTRKYFGEDGIVQLINTENTENALGITKVARPYRAVADMVIVSLFNGKKTDHIQYEDWIVTEEERNSLKKLLEKSLKKMNTIEKEKVKAWIAEHL